MHRRSRQILSFFWTLLVLGLLFPAGILYADQTSSESGAEQGAQQERTGVAHLYFISPKGYHLAAEDRRLEADQAPALHAKALIQALLDGPRGDGLRCIPEDTRLLAVYVRNGLCYVDFSREISQGLPGGAEAEYMTVFALVNTLCLNVQDISSVKILIEGKEAETLGGHVELTYPFGADMTIIR
ncbi:conserved hypothetical protein [Desulfatibacillum aliphaticivorans]|uniref:GerMN domain-containing protein n=1 Tax=Desulfatibacillum aliphaticivorans TaxID=218208 RepID=B8FBJ2_DESAL|nr:conserved hypothetical protein [Desulfatibacillum aliphaticivorans]